MAPTTHKLSGHTGTQSPAVAIPRHLTGSRAGTALRNSYAAARAPSTAAQSQAGTPSHLTSRMTNLQLNTSVPTTSTVPSATWNPSQAPSPSAMNHNGLPSVASGAASGTSVQQPVNTAICTISRWQRRDYKHGQIISLPYHTPNTNPNVSQADPNLTVSPFYGGIYSKRRMMVVLYIYGEALHCLPIYSFGNRGLSHKPGHLKKEYVCLRNSTDKNFLNEGIRKPLEVKMRVKDLSITSTLHLTGGIRVGFNEDIAFCGRLTEKSYNAALALWEQVVVDAQNMPWRN
nr:hypothetical protein B0A51_12707 [Rachicladosporium sp. CCFEE 5018]